MFKFATTAIKYILKPIVLELLAEHEKRIKILEREAVLIFRDVQTIGAHQVQSMSAYKSDSKLPLN